MKRSKAHSTKAERREKEADVQSEANDIIQIPTDATCRSLVEAARAALGSPRQLGYFDNALLRVTFPVKPGARYWFKRTVLGVFTLTPILRAETEVENFAGNTAAWLVLMTMLRPASGFYCTLPPEDELVQLDNNLCAPYFDVIEFNRDLGLRDVEEGFRANWEVNSFREEPPPA